MTTPNTTTPMTEEQINEAVTMEVEGKPVERYIGTNHGSLFVSPGGYWKNSFDHKGISWLPRYNFTTCHNAAAKVKEKLRGMGCYVGSCIFPQSEEKPDVLIVVPPAGDEFEIEHDNNEPLALCRAFLRVTRGM